MPRSDIFVIGVEADAESLLGRVTERVLVCHLDVRVLDYLQTIPRCHEGGGSYSKEAERGVWLSSSLAVSVIISWKVRCLKNYNYINSSTFIASRGFGVLGRKADPATLLFTKLDVEVRHSDYPQGECNWAIVFKLAQDEKSFMFESFFKGFKYGQKGCFFREMYLYYFSVFIYYDHYLFFEKILRIWSWSASWRRDSPNTSAKETI